MNDNVEILRRYNRWRRGQALWSATADLPDPRVVGEAIDAACDEIERLRAEISTAEAFHKVAVAERNYERQRADILESATIKALEDRDRLRAELAECIAALEKIANPISAMKRALPVGATLNGAMATTLSNDPSYLKEIAKAALAARKGEGE